MESIIDCLNKGGVVVTKTDTIYGILSSAVNKNSIERVYKIKGRDENKPFIILIPDAKSLRDFAITPKTETQKLIDKSWPGPVTLIFDLPKEKLEKFKYLHRGSGALAFRVPKDKFISDLVRKTGPLVAPSANPQGREPARNIDEAAEYFNNDIDLYHDRGTVTNNTPSRIIKIDRDGEIEILRK